LIHATASETESLAENNYRTAKLPLFICIAVYVNFPAMRSDFISSMLVTRSSMVGSVKSMKDECSPSSQLEDKRLQAEIFNLLG